MFILKIATNNDAFQEDCRGEIARILQELADKIYQAKEPSVLLDFNGNKVGKVEWNI